MKKKIIMFAGIVLGFLALSYAFVPQVLQGKIVNQSDISGWQGMAHETQVWNAEHRDSPASWTGSMFSGMPATTITLVTRGDWTQKVYDFLLTGRRPATYLFVSLLGAFLLLLSLGVSPLVAAGGAVAITFCAYNMQIIQVGHNTKMQAIAFLPWVLAALVLTYRSALGEIRGPWLPFTVLGAALFAFALSFQVKANHQQISYYLALVILLYVITLAVWLLTDRERRRSLSRFAVASALLLVLGFLGIAANSIKLMPLWEYTPYSMRGGNGKAQPDDANGGRKGLELDYATAWSYGWEELPNLLIPDFNGGSSSGAIKPSKSETYKVLKKAGQSNLNEVCRNLPLYWGPQPFTAGPMYMGAVTIFLFILGLLIYRGKEKWWLVAATVVAVLLALGNHFMWFTRLFYDYMPFYNKFRTVSMSLTVLQFTLPLLGFVALDRILRDEGAVNAFRRKGWIALAISGGFCLLCVLVPSIAGSFVSPADAGMSDRLVNALAADRQALLKSDALRSFLFIAAAWALLFWGCHYSQYRRTAVLLVCILGLCDLTFVGKRYLGPDDFVTPGKFDRQFAKRKVDEFILQDTDPSFRVLDLTTNVFNDSHPSYWHKSIGGYSPAKLQIYQEYIENHLEKEISVLNSAINSSLRDCGGSLSGIEAALPELEGLSNLNCRYIIIAPEYPPLRYPYARGNAWFKKGEGTITLRSYAPDTLVYDFDSERGGDAVFSEVYYPAGWKARLEDGTQLPISLSDEVLRSVILPAGKHTLTMSFEPDSYNRGEKISRAASIALIIVILLSASGAVYYGRKEWK